MPKLEQLNEPMYDAFLRDLTEKLAKDEIPQRAAAKIAGTTLMTINRVLNKHVQLRAVYMLRLAKALGISLDQYTGAEAKKDIVEAVREAMVQHERIAGEIPNTVTLNTKYVSPARRAMSAPERTLFGMHIEFDDLVDNVLCIVGRRDPELKPEEVQNDQRD